MAEQRIFTFEGTDKMDQHRLYSVDHKEASALISEGKAVEVNLPELDGFRKQSAELTRKFKAEEQKIKSSTDPRDTAEVKVYELKKLESQYQADIKAVESDYQKYRQEALDVAKTSAAQSVTDVTDRDRRVAEQFASREALDLQLIVNKHEKSAKVIEIASDVRRMTDEQKTALQANIGSLLAHVDDTADKRKLVSAVKDVRNPDVLTVKVAESLPHTAINEYHVLKVLRKW
jgi:hypothetical protein